MIIKINCFISRFNSFRGGNVGIEKAAKKAGKNIKVPFIPGRGDASQDQTDKYSFGLLEPKADGFRNYIVKKSNGSSKKPNSISRRNVS